MKIKLYSFYPRFNDFQLPKYIEWSDDGKIEAYQDPFISLGIQNKDNGKKKIAIITEPRCIWNLFYQTDLSVLLKENQDVFEYIFTYDPITLKLSNAKPMPFAGVWDTNDLPKTKNISMCCSNKSMCEGHLLRKKVADKLKNKVDVLSDYLGPTRVSTKDIYGEYKYSVVMENEKDEWYFTEKVLNAFANKCIPIYYGSPKILDIFNKDGIIYVEDINNIENIIDNLNLDEYENHLKAIEENYEKVKKYICFEDYLYETYKDLLEEL